MVNKIKNIMTIGLILLGFIATFQSVFVSNYAFAQDNSGGGNSSSSPQAKTAILPDTWSIEDILNMILVVVTTGVGIAAVGSIVFAGILYITARDNAAQVSKAKTMIMNTIIGVVAYVLMWAFLEWIIPGGVIS